MVSTKDELSLFVALKGQQGLSEFRIKALLELIKKDFSQVQSIDCDEFFFCSLLKKNNRLNTQTENKLCKILKAQTIKKELKSNEFLLIPRIGTISPWSAKATEILTNAGFDSLTRIERAV